MQGVSRPGASPINSKKEGAKWVLRYVSPITGKRRNAGLGSYPEVSAADAGNQACRLMRVSNRPKVQTPLDMKKAEDTKTSDTHCRNCSLPGSPTVTPRLAQS